MAYLGDFAEDATVYTWFSTNDSSGGRVAFSGTLEAADFEVIKDGSTTGSTTGVTVTNAFDSKTGIHKVEIDMSADAFYTTGSDYALILYPDTETVDSQNVATIIAEWSCENRFQEVDVTRWLGTAVATPTTAGVPEVDVTFVSGTAQTANDIGADVNAILVDTNSLNDTKIPDTISLAAINGQVDTALSDIGLDHLLSAAVVGTDVTDNSVVAKLVSASATADWDDFVNTTDSLQALRDRGDAAWTTGGGGSISDIISWTPLIPTAIDLANTKTWRFGIALTNMLDDLPTTVEITPGTISIDRAAQGGTTWTAVVTDAACSEIDGLIYYDEVFDTATGYAAGDVLRVTFKSALVTVSANDYELYGATGRVFYTGIIADTPDVNVASINGSTANVAAMNLFFGAVNAGTGQLDSGSFAAGAITSTSLADGSITAAKIGTDAITADKIAADAIGASELAADAVSEIQSGLATAAALATVDTNVDAILVDTGTTLPATLGTPAGLSMSADIAAVQTTADAVETDTQDIQGRLPATLNNGSISADVQRINDVAVVGDGSGTPFTV